MILSLSPSIDGFTGGALDVRFAYSPQTIERLKALIPFYDRAWDKERKVWVVAMDYAPVLLREFGADLSIDPNAVGPVMDTCSNAERSMLRLIATATKLTPVAAQWLERHPLAVHT